MEKKIAFFVVVCFSCLGYISYTIHFTNNSHLSILIKSKKSPKGEHKFWDDHPPPFESICSTSNKYISDPSKIDPMTYEFLATPEGRSYKRILAWNHAYQSDYYVGYGFYPFEMQCCKEKRCFLSPRINPLKTQEFDAILFHHRNVKKSELPRQRTQLQRWILYDKEPPPLSGKTPEEFNGIFNWTMTYQEDADVMARYGYFYPRYAVSSEIDRKYFKNIIFPPENKKLAAWVVSNCNTSSKREKFVKLLQKYIKVDIYGKCGNLKCNKVTCFEKLERTYKFYFAFENSMCTNYITEKFYRTLSLSMVPVVLGHANHEYVAPPHSYIDASKFDSPQSLANYLLYLDKNDTAYLEYFRWKKDYVSLDQIQTINFCNLCRKLHMENLESSSYDDLRGWWVDKANCTSII